MTPRILLVEDDPVTCAYLVAVIEALPASVQVARSLAEARRCVVEGDHALWLVDANLPDGSGAELLEDWRASGRHTPAIAHTASHDRDALQALLDAGFCQALAKPISAANLLAALRQQLDGPSRHAADIEHARTDPGQVAIGDGPAVAAIRVSATAQSAALWDDAIAMAALGGQRNHVDALRALFTGELPASRDAVAAAVEAGSNADVRDTLHRLQASCAFVGASRLLRAVEGLHDAPLSALAFEDFDIACRETLATR